MLRPILLSALAMLAIGQFSACASQAAIDHADAMALTSEQRADIYRRHGGDREATRGAALFAQSYGMAEETGGRKVEIGVVPHAILTKVMMAKDPLRPEFQSHVGWVEERWNLTNTFKVATFYDLSWVPVAYNNKDGFTGRRNGGSVEYNPRIMPLAEAAAWVFGARGSSSVDTALYAKTTILREKDDWYTEQANARGIAIRDVEPRVRLLRLGNEETVRYLANLQKKEFYLGEAAKQKAIQVERLGEYNDLDDRKIAATDPSEED